MKNVKLQKLVTIFLAVVLVLGFAACGGTQQGAEKPDDSKPNAGSEQPVGQKPDDSKPNAGGEQPADPQPEVHYGGVLKMHGVSTSAVFCDLNKSVGAGYIAGCVETLGLKNIATNEITPLLAESWEFDEATNTVTAHLRKGVKFHDGSDFNAEVVKWCYDTAKENNRLANAHNFDTEIVDEHTVKIIFDKFYLDWEESALTRVHMYSKKAYDANGGKDGGLDYLGSHPVGTGAFEFVELITDQKVVYTKNENYWQKDAYGNQLPYLDGYEVHFISDQNAAMMAFVNGEVDHLVGTDNAIVDQLVANGYENKCVPIPVSTTTFEVYANTLIKDSPWADVNVRKAVFLYGIDWEDLTKLAGGSTAICTHNINLEGTLMDDPTINEEYQYDLEKAKKMLADAGYPNGFDTGLETTGISVPCATVLQEKLKALGINAEITQVGGGDARRYDPSIPGLAMWATTTNWDTIVAPLGTMHSPADLAGNTTQGPVVKVDFSDEYRELFSKAYDAKTYEERAEWGKKAIRQLYIEDVNSTLCYVKANAQFINDKCHNTDFEYNWSSPTTAWKEP